MVFKGATKDKTTLQPANLCYFIRAHLKNASWGWVLIIEFQQPTGGENEESGSVSPKMRAMILTDINAEKPGGWES